MNLDLNINEGKEKTIMLNKKTVDDLKDLKGKKVLVRCDFNVPLKSGEITDETRIVRSEERRVGKECL